MMGWSATSRCKPTSSAHALHSIVSGAPGESPKLNTEHPKNLLIWRGGTTPILEKTLRECRGKWKSFGWVRGNSGNRSESCSENCGFRIDQVVRGHSENGISYSENGISNSESCSENTPELSESSENGLFTPRAFFLKLGWSPGFWFKAIFKK